MKLPKRLRVDTACYYQLPPDTPATELTFHEVLFRHHYLGIFTQRVGSTFFFQLPNERDRDVFLDILEGLARKDGFLIERETVFA